MDLNIIKGKSFYITIITLIATALILILTASIFFVYSFVYTELSITSVIGFIGLLVICLPISIYEYIFNKQKTYRKIFLSLAINVSSLTLSGVLWYILPQNFNWVFLVPTGMLLMACSYMPLIYVMYGLYAEKKDKLPAIVKQLITYIIVIFILFSSYYTMTYLLSDIVKSYDMIIYTFAIIGDVIIITLAAVLILISLSTKLRYVFSIIFGYVVLSFIGDSLRLLSYSNVYQNINYSQTFYDLMLIFLSTTLIFYVLSNVKLTTVEDIVKKLENTTLVIDDLITQSPDPMGLFDSNGYLLKANDQFIQSFKISKDEYNNFNIFNKNHEFYREIVSKFSDPRSIKSVHLENIKYKSFNDEIKYYSIKLFPTISSENAILNYMIIVDDVTARKKAEDDLKNAYDNMENRVKERTIELSELNLTLQKEIVEHMKDEEKIKASLKEKEVMLKEIHHRVKNNMQIISSMIGLQASTVEDQKFCELLKDSQHRIKSMAIVHENLYQSDNMAFINFEEYVNNLIWSIKSTYNVNKKNIEIVADVDKVSLDMDIAIPVGLIINELITNAYKHAFIDNRPGTIMLQIKEIETKKYQMILKDNGVGMDPNFDIENSKSLGLKLVNALVNQLEAEKILKIDNGGSEYTIVFCVN